MLLISNTSEIRDEKKNLIGIQILKTLKTTEPIGLTCFIVFLDLLKFSDTPQFRKRSNLTHLLITRSH